MTVTHEVRGSKPLRGAIKFGVVGSWKNPGFSKFRGLMSWIGFSSQQQGNAGMGRAIAYFTSLGYTISLPMNDCQDYDLVVEIDGKLNKVQVKTSRCKAPSGNYRVSLVSSGGNKRSIYHRVANGSCDLLFVATEDGLNYIIPVDNNLPKKTLTVYPKDALVNPSQRQ